MHNAAAVLRKNAEKYAKTMALEMGKPIVEGRGEIDKCASVCEFYADNAEAFLGDELTPSDASKSYAAFRPIGAVLAVMPWNFPFWQVFRFAAPALMAGMSGCSSTPPMCRAVHYRLKRSSLRPVSLPMFSGP